MRRILSDADVRTLYRVFDEIDDAGRDQALRALTLKYGPAPFARGSATSAAAAKKVRPGRGPTHQRILKLIAFYGPMTDEQLEKSLGGKHQTISARRRELVIAGKLKEAGTSEPGSRFPKTLWGLA